MVDQIEQEKVLVTPQVGEVDVVEVHEPESIPASQQNLNLFRNVLIRSGMIALFFSLSIASALAINSDSKQFTLSDSIRSLFVLENESRVRNFADGLKNFNVNALFNDLRTGELRFSNELMRLKDQPGNSIWQIYLKVNDFEAIPNRLKQSLSVPKTIASGTNRYHWGVTLSIYSRDDELKIRFSEGYTDDTLPDNLNTIDWANLINNGAVSVIGTKLSILDIAGSISRSDDDLTVYQQVKFNRVSSDILDCYVNYEVHYAEDGRVTVDHSIAYSEPAVLREIPDSEYERGQFVNEPGSISTAVGLTSYGPRYDTPFFIYNDDFNDMVCPNPPIEP